MVLNRRWRWFGLFSTRATVEWTSGLNPIRSIDTHLFNWSFITLGFCLLSVWLQSPRLEEGREEEESMYNTCSAKRIAERLCGLLQVRRHKLKCLVP